MATKKKAGKASGTKKLVRKSKSSSSKKSQAKKTVTKPKSSKGKKPAAPKKSKPKSGKSAASAKKTNPAAASKKKKPSKLSAGTIKKPAASKLATAKKTGKPKRVVPQQAKTAITGLSGLSPQERYNVGGLCACIIETSTKEGQDQLERVLRHLNLSDLDQSNLIRVSQGLRIPKLFADGLVGTETRKSVLQGLAQFAKTDDPSGKTWKTELEDFARLLGN